MNLVSQCKSCKETISIKSSSSTRPELEAEKGENFLFNCSNCGSDNKLHVNDIEAISSKSILLYGTIASVIVTIVLWQILGAVGTITLGIPLLMWRIETSSVNAFNIYRLPRT